MKKSRLISIVIAAAAVLAASGFFVWLAGRKTESGLPTVAVRRADLVSSVRADGAVKAAESVDLAFERSGRIASVKVKEGDAVKRGQTLIALDQSDASASLRGAQANLEAAKLALSKLKEPPQALDLLQAQDAVKNAADAEEKAGQDLAKAYDDAWNAMSNAYADLPAFVAGLHDILHGTTLNSGQDNLDYYADTANVYTANAYPFRDAAESAYLSAKSAVDGGMVGFKSADRSSSASADAALSQAYAAAKQAADAVKSASNLIQLYRDELTRKQIVPAPASDAHLAALTGYAAKANADYSALSGAQKSLSALANSLASSERAYAERQAALKRLQDGAERVDLDASAARVAAAQASVDAAASAMAKGILSAPFDGKVFKVEASAGEMAAPGIAQVSLVSSARLEIDISVSEDQIGAVRVGQAAEVALDAFGGEKFPATVISVSPAAQFVQGVGSYPVKLQFAGDDERVKPGMGANAAIAVDSRSRALAVPQGAVIARGAEKIVMVPGNDGKPQERKVALGLAGDGGLVEVLSGLSEGDRVISFGNGR